MTLLLNKEVHILYANLNNGKLNVGHNLLKSLSTLIFESHML